MRRSKAIAPVARPESEFAKLRSGDRSYRGPDLTSPGERGVTLIELMIAITLVGMLSAGLLFAMRSGLLTEERISAKLAANRRAINIQDMLNRQLAGAIPVLGACTSSDGPPSSIPFMRGTESSLRFVSTFSMAQGDRGLPQIVEYQVQRAVGGGFRLAMAEHPFTGPASTAPFCRDRKFLPVDVGPAAFIAADRLLACRIAFKERPNVFTYADSLWLDVWDRPTLPGVVKIDMQPAAVSALPFISITAVMRPDRNALTQYVDSY